jgi:CheY-like chemotaxis protein
MLGGSIDVASEPGKGSSFRVRLPARAPELTAATHGQVGEAEAGSIPAETGAPSRTVLVIDDDASARDLIARFLRREGFGVIEATGGEEGLRLAREHRPSVITLDVVMPGMDGWTVLGLLQGDPELADTPVILLTMTDDRNLGYALGASEFLTKPIDWQRLGAALERYAGERARRRWWWTTTRTPGTCCAAASRRPAGASSGRTGAALTRASRRGAPDPARSDDAGDGRLEFLDEFRKHAAWRRVPVLVVTAKELRPRTARLSRRDAHPREGSLTSQQLLDEVKGLVGTHFLAKRRDDVRA